MSFYRIPKTVFRARGNQAITPSMLDSVILHIGSQWIYLHGRLSSDAKKRLSLHGAEKIADSWRELKNVLSATQRSKIFHVRVRRSEIIDGRTEIVESAIPRDEKLPTDEVLSDWLVPHVFLGDPEPERVP